jgi:DNA-binding transcriptional ArsR family regulator
MAAPDAHTASANQARLLAALADPSRLRIIGCLRGGPRTVGQLAEALQLAVVNASHHLGILRHSGIVQDHKRGRFVEYRLHPEVFRPAGKSGGPESLRLDGLRLEFPG